jgi:CBS-domain-containing membrane protein
MNAPELKSTGSNSAASNPAGLNSTALNSTALDSTAVREVMSADVVTVRSFVPFRRIAATMLSRGIGAVPVVDSMGHAIGVISRTDLIAKQAANAEGQNELWELLSRRGRRAQTRSDATTAGRLMTPDVVTVTPETGVARAAYLMERHAVSHLPVVNDRNVVVGIVSRSDLLNAYLRDDREIRYDVLRSLESCVPDLDLEKLEVGVAEGVVKLSGPIERRHAAHAVRHTRVVRGVVDVIDELERHDDETAEIDTFSPGPIF